MSFKPRTDLWNPDTLWVIPNKQTMGDTILYTPLPEIFYYDHGVKMSVLFSDRFGCYRDNPYCDLYMNTTTPPGGFKRSVMLWANQHPFLKGSPCFKQVSKYRDISDVDQDLKPMLYFDMPEPDEGKIAITTEASRRKQKGRTRTIPVEISTEFRKKLGSRYELIQVGGPKDYAIEGITDRRGTTIPEMARIIAGCKYYICLNSGPMHVAAATKTQLVMHMNEEIERPVWESDYRRFTAHDWLYDSTHYIGPNQNQKNVQWFRDWIEEIL